MDNIQCIGNFSYILLKETEKAIYAKVPYWKPTGEHVKKHEQEFFTCWIPKYILSKQDHQIQHFVIEKKEEIRKSNGYQRVLYTVPTYYKTFGYFAPLKEKYIREEIDSDKLSILRKELMVKCGVKDFDRILIDGPSDCIGSVLTDEECREIERYAVRIRNPKINDEIIPKKKVIYYI